MDVRNKWNLFESLKKVYLDNDLQYECLASVWLRMEQIRKIDDIVRHQNKNPFT